MCALVVTVETVTRIINRCRVFELLYTSETIPPPQKALDNLHDSLVKLYAVILQLIAHSRELFSKSTAARTIRAILLPGETSGLTGQLMALEQVASEEARVCDSQRKHNTDAETKNQLETLQRYLEEFRPIISNARDLFDIVTASEQLEILEWTSKVLYTSHHSTMKELRTDGTCEWLLKNSGFHQWHNKSTSAVLLLYGYGK